MDLAPTLLRRPAAPSPAPDAAPRIALRQARWVDGRLELTGFAREPGHSSARRGSARTLLTLLPPDGRRPVRLLTSPLLMPEVTEESGQGEHSYDWSGFTAVLDPARLRQGGRWPAGVWLVRATLFAGLHRRLGTLAPHWCGSGEYPLGAWVAPRVRVQPFFGDDGLRLRVVDDPPRVTAVRRRPAGLLLDCAGPGADGGELLLTNRETGTALRCPVRRTADGHAAEVPLAALSPGGAAVEHWDLLLAGTAALLDERAGPVGGQYRLPGGDRVVHLKSPADGSLQLCVRPPLPVVEDLAAVADGFRLTGRQPGVGAGPAELVLRHTDGTAETLHRVRTPAPDRFELLVPVGAATSYGGSLPLRRGVWDLLLRPVGRPEAEQRLTLAPGPLAQLPAALAAGAKTVTLQRRWHDTLILDAHPVLPPAERGDYAQARLRSGYRTARRLGLRQAVLYDNFGGRGYADSPRAVHAELLRRGAPLEHLWAVDDAQAELPPGVVPVRVGSHEWHRALATSRYLVGNTHFPEFLHRRGDQVVVQTWHGTPLKRIAHDVDHPWLRGSGYLERLAREVPHWSLLVSPSPFATPILRRAFQYRGEILECGYPRNDQLVRPDQRAARQIRRRLGLAPDRRVVLYAPTWREDRRHHEGYHFDLHLDPAAARRVLGPDTALLVRPHAHVRDRLPGAGDGFLYDVGDYPDVQDLLLIADVLVTDYSSLLFDFAIRGRPMLFFTYDLEHYRDALRGFYLDFAAVAPGPLLTGPGQLLEALADPQAAVAPFQDRYQAFRQRFCPLDDGRATARLVDRMLHLG
ncbi:CDP-glycerol glycerophosphotransferase family protein [Kitasatospora sp. NPDC058965]|uniref:CDP-glycerol glycerophosphotransferase family protein n=1 Tax=Kitasatospora sp. NPDC058965 TaxID=3346682 RepID=UPI003680A440